MGIYLLLSPELAIAMLACARMVRCIPSSSADRARSPWATVSMTRRRRFYHRDGG